MRIARTRLIPYRLPLRQPWCSARGEFQYRAGWLIEVETDCGRTGYGDCAPLPEAGTEGPATAFAFLEELATCLTGTETPTALDQLDAVPVTFPAARCGVETALLDLLAQHANEPIARWLASHAMLTIPVNATLGPLNDAVAQRIEQSLAQGFRVLKLKVGLRPVQEELARLRSLTADLPLDARLRLDANGSWDEAEAARFLAGLVGLPVESVEEPLDEPELAALARLQRAASVPLALDESLARLPVDALLAQCPVHRLILKPMALGGLRPARALAQRAHAAGLECIVTTTVDSAVGVRAAAHLAASLLGNNLAHGLATSSWLRHDLHPPPRIEAGILILDDLPGLGIR